MLRFTSLGNRILTTMILITITTILILSAIFVFISGRTITSNFESILIEMVKTKSIEIENLMEDAQRMNLMLANDASIQRILRQPRPEIKAEAYGIELEQDNKLSFIHTYTSNVFGFYIIGANGMQFKSNFSSPLDESWQEHDWYKRIIESPVPIWFDPHPGSFTVNTIGQPLVTLGQRIIDKSTGDILGVILTDIEVSVLERLVSTGMGEIGILTLYNQNRTPVCSTSEEWMEAPYPSGVRKDSLTSYTFINRYLSPFNWELLGAIHTTLIRNSVMTMLKPVFLVFVLLILVDFIAAVSFVNRVTGPLKELTATMERIDKENFDISMPPHPDDDVGILYDSFNMMVSRIKNLMNDLYEEHEKLRVSEMRTLEAQINPHFLYNTLDSIIWLARKEKSGEVTTLVYSLTKLLRIGLNKGRALITIKEEVEYIRSYMTIQDIRFGDDFTFTMDVPESMMNHKTVKLILQPIMENAIYHGVMKGTGQGSIALTAQLDGNDIVFSITDSGPGMDESELEEVQSYLDINKESERGFGLRNVNMRVKLYFGQPFGLSIESQKGSGTVVSIRIPRM